MSILGTTGSTDPLTYARESCMETMFLYFMCPSLWWILHYARACVCVRVLRSVCIRDFSRVSIDFLMNRYYVHQNNCELSFLINKISEFLIQVHSTSSILAYSTAWPTFLPLQSESNQSFGQEDCLINVCNMQIPVTCGYQVLCISGCVLNITKTGNVMIALKNGYSKLVMITCQNGYLEETLEKWLPKMAWPLTFWPQIANYRMTCNDLSFGVPTSNCMSVFACPSINKSIAFCGKKQTSYRNASIQYAHTGVQSNNCMASPIVMLGLLWNTCLLCIIFFTFTIQSC